MSLFAVTTTTIVATLAFSGTPATTAPPPAVRAPTPLAGKVITIDPGHNGENAEHASQINQLVSVGKGEKKECDTVGTSTNGGYPESRFNFAVARQVRKLLRAKGAKVVFTRKDDDGWGPCINRRARIGNRADSDAAVSIHADGGPSSGRGFHVIYPTKIRGLTNDIYRPSKRLADDLRDMYRRESNIPPANYVGSGGLDRRGDLGGLRLSNVPKVFIETGNMRNGSDAARMTSRRGRAKIAFGIFRGLARFLKR